MYHARKVFSPYVFSYIQIKFNISTIRMLFLERHIYGSYLGSFVRDVYKAPSRPASLSRHPGMCLVGKHQAPSQPSTARVPLIIVLFDNHVKNIVNDVLINYLLSCIMDSGPVNCTCVRLTLASF
jgi:hypothetical protein